MQEDSICSQSGDLTSSNESFCLQVKIQCPQANTKITKPQHLITNLAYSLKLHHKRNQYLRARLDTCANIYIMPVSVYKLVFHDPNWKKLAPSKLEIGTNTTNTVKVVWSCVFYLVHPNTKHWQEVTFYVASNNGSVLLFCMTTLALALYSLKLDWAIFHPEPSLLLSVLTTQRRQSPKSMYMFPEKSTVSNHKGIAPSFLQARMRFLVLHMFLMVLDAFLLPPYCIQGQY